MTHSLPAPPAASRRRPSLRRRYRLGENRCLSWSRHLLICVLRLRKGKLIIDMPGLAQVPGLAAIVHWGDCPVQHAHRAAIGGPQFEHTAVAWIQKQHLTLGRHGTQNLPQRRYIHRSEEHTSELQSLMRISY